MVRSDRLKITKSTLTCGGCRTRCSGGREVAREEVVTEAVCVHPIELARFALRGVRGDELLHETAPIDR
eukprot:3133715-Prymnesium_polylepis.1